MITLLLLLFPSHQLHSLGFRKFGPSPLFIRSQGPREQRFIRPRSQTLFNLAPGRGNGQGARERQTNRETPSSIPQRSKIFVKIFAAGHPRNQEKRGWPASFLPARESRAMFFFGLAWIRPSFNLGGTRSVLRVILLQLLTVRSPGEMELDCFPDRAEGKAHTTASRISSWTGPGIPWTMNSRGDSPGPSRRLSNNRCRQAHSRRYTARRLLCTYLRWAQPLARQPSGKAFP